MATLSHLERGKARMVDVGAKSPALREAVAFGEISLSPAVVSLLKTGKAGKGDVLGAARIAGIMAAKKTSDLIPLCHPLRLDAVKVSFRLEKQRLLIRALARAEEKTGVEMEALTAVSIAALTVYDMCKSVDRGMTIECIRLEEKSGGKSGTFQRAD